MEKETGKGSPDKKGAAVRQEDKGQRERGESPRFILILNPGSTSTKIALYQEETQIFSDCINHNPEELGAFAVVFDQLEYRLEIVNQVLKSHLVDRGCLSAVMGRGGMVYGLKTGGYLVDERLFEALKGGEHTSEHASNLGGLMAYVLARPLGIPAFIYDACLLYTSARHHLLSGIGF